MALGAHLHPQRAAPGAQVGLGTGVDGEPGHANGGGGAHGQDERGRVGFQSGESVVRELRGEAQVGVDLGIDVLRRGCLVAQADIIDEDGEI